MRQYSKLAVTAAAVAVATLLAACGGSSDSSEVSESAPEETTEQTEAAEATEGDGTISLDGGGKKISVFMPSTSNNYLAEWRRGLEATAADLNFKVTVVENNFDQSEMDLQIQQALAAGETPDIYVFWPADSKAGVASLRALSQTGVPTVVANQRKRPGRSSLHPVEICSRFASLLDIRRPWLGPKVSTKPRVRFHLTKSRWNTVVSMPKRDTTPLRS